MIELVPIEARYGLAVLRLVDQLITIILLLVKAISLILLEEVQSENVTRRRQKIPSPVQCVLGMWQPEYLAGGPWLGKLQLLRNSRLLVHPQYLHLVVLFQVAAHAHQNRLVAILVSELTVGEAQCEDGDLSLIVVHFTLICVLTVLDCLILSCRLLQLILLEHLSYRGLFYHFGSCFVLKS